jgi:hypothetical protein
VQDEKGINMISNSESAQQMDGNKAFWSPLLIFFFLGTPFAALNWWRMGWKRKAIIFLCISVVVGLLETWLRQGRPYTDTVWANSILIILPFFVSIIYHLALAFIMFYDIRTFSLSGMASNTVNWTIVFPFILSTALISTGILFGSDYLAKTTKYCHFPRFQDLLYDHEIGSRSELRIALMNRYDTGCNIAWGMESEDSFPIQNQMPKPTNSIYYMLTGRQNGISTSFITMDQIVELYPNPITQAMIDSQVEKIDGVKLSLEIPFDSIHANLFRSNCFQGEVNKYCIITLGYKHVLTWFKVAQIGISDSDFEKVIAETIDNVDQRIYEYETTTP